MRGGIQQGPPLKQSHEEGIYSVPPSALSKPAHSSSSPESAYDFPPNSELPGLHRRQQNHHHPRYPPANDNEGIYDVPPAKHHSTKLGLRRQLGRLEDSQQILLQTFQTLETCGWTVAALATSPAPSSSARQQQQQHARSDELDRFVMVSRTLPDDAKQLASTIQGSAELLFSRRGVGVGGDRDGGSSSSRGGTPEESLSHPLGYYPSPDNDNNYSCPVKAFPPVPSGQEKDNMNMNSEKCVKSWMEDYDYVHLQGKEDFERQQKELLDKENIIKQNRLLLGPEGMERREEFGFCFWKGVEATSPAGRWTSLLLLPRMRRGVRRRRAGACLHLDLRRRCRACALASGGGPCWTSPPSRMRRDVHRWSWTLLMLLRCCGAM
ncbi:hypothetical protein CRUP_022580 [Coryphaenoides rupestris]|nr:hypothetical protein CRUP_022580 [Coryphaenoides rupestris]